MLNLIRLSPAEGEANDTTRSASGAEAPHPMTIFRPLTIGLGLLALWQAVVWVSGAPPYILPAPGARFPAGGSWRAPTPWPCMPG